MNNIENLIEAYLKERNTFNAEALEAALIQHLNLHPQDTNAWIKLALVLYHAPLHSDLEAADCMRKILTYDPNNIKALLCLIYMIVHCQYFKEELFKELLEKKTDDAELNALIEYVKSWYYSEKSPEYELCLLKSIEYRDDFVKNHVRLGQYYVSKNILDKGWHHLKKGYNNIKKIYDKNANKFNPLDYEDFFNERLKGTSISYVNAEIIMESFDPNSPWITGNFSKVKDTPEENQ